MAGNTSKPGASVAGRILAVLDTFDSRHRSQRLSDIARRADIPLPTAHRLVRDLLAWGALTRSDSGAYQIGRRLWDLGLLAAVNTGLREIAEPFLHDIYAATLATVHIAVLDGPNALYLDRVAGHASVPVVSNVGTRLPLYSTGVGKVLLAHAPLELQQMVLADLKPVTPYTVVSPSRLRGELARVIHDGYAQTNEEMTLGACSIAVPVRDHSDQVIAALGMVTANLRRDKQASIGALQVAAQGIRRSMLSLSGRRL